MSTDSTIAKKITAETKHLKPVFQGYIQGIADAINRCHGYNPSDNYRGKSTPEELAKNFLQSLFAYNKFPYATFSDEISPLTLEEMQDTRIWDKINQEFLAVVKNFPELFNSTFRNGEFSLPFEYKVVPVMKHFAEFHILRPTDTSYDVLSEFFKHISIDKGLISDKSPYHVDQRIKVQYKTLAAFMKFKSSMLFEQFKEKFPDLEKSAEKGIVRLLKATTHHLPGELVGYIDNIATTINDLNLHVEKLYNGDRLPKETLAQKFLQSLFLAPHPEVMDLLSLDRMKNTGIWDKINEEFLEVTKQFPKLFHSTFGQSGYSETLLKRVPPVMIHLAGFHILNPTDHSEKVLSEFFKYIKPNSTISDRSPHRTDPHGKVIYKNLAALMKSKSPKLFAKFTEQFPDLENWAENGMEKLGPTTQEVGVQTNATGDMLHDINSKALSDLKIKIAELEQKSQELEEAAKEIEGQRADLEARAKALEIKEVILREQEAALKAQAELQAQEEVLQPEEQDEEPVDPLAERLARLHEDRAKLEDERAQLEDLRTELDAKESALKEDRVLLKREQSKLTKEKAQLEKDNEQIEAISSELQKSLARVENKEKALERQKAELEVQKALYEEQKAAFEAQIRTLLTPKALVEDADVEATGGCHDSHEVI